MASKERDFRRVRARLAEDFPIGCPVLVRRVKMVGAKEYGELRVKPDKFIIHINKQHALGTQIETLLHEWAHALVWHPNERVVHRTEWARMYVKLLRWVQGEGEWDVCLDNIPRPLETPGQVE